MQARLLNLPPELLLQISFFLDDESLAKLSETCRFFHVKHAPELKIRFLFKMMKTLEDGLNRAADNIKKIEVGELDPEIVGLCWASWRNDIHHKLLMDVIFSITDYIKKGIRLDASIRAMENALIQKYREVFDDRRENFFVIYLALEDRKKLIVKQQQEKSQESSKKSKCIIS